MKSLLKNKKIIIVASVIMLLTAILTCGILYRNYSAYNKYLVVFKNYGYENSDFYENNKLVKFETLNYMQYELDEFAKETNNTINQFRSKYNEVDLNGTPKEQLDTISYYLYSKFNEIKEQIKLTDKSNDSEKETFNDLNTRLSELTDNSELDPLLKMQIIDDLILLKEEVENFNKSVDVRIAKEEEEKKRAEEEKQQHLAAQQSNSNSWTASSSSNSSNSGNWSSSSSTSSSSNIPDNWGNLCPYKDRNSAIAVGDSYISANGGGYQVSSCGDGTFRIRYYDGVDREDAECLVLC